MKVRSRVAELVEGKGAQTFITVLIILNAVTLGLETSPSIVKEYGRILGAFDTFVLSIFVVEITLKLGENGGSTIEREFAAEVPAWRFRRPRGERLCTGL